MSISFQLYSARNFTPWGDVLATLAELGYPQVEGFGVAYEDPAAFKALLDKHGLTMPSGHFGLDDLEQNLPDVLAAAKVLGIQHVICPNLASTERPSDSAGWQVIAQRLAAIGSKVRAAGFTFAWHNHNFEFVPCTDNGAMPLAIMLDHDPEMKWEADIAWVARGGADPLEWIERYGDRIHIAHGKDIAPQGECLDEDGWADFGHGILDWKTIAQALHQHGTNMIVMEHDNPNDLRRFASRAYQSYQALKGV